MTDGITVGVAVGAGEPTAGAGLGELATGLPRTRVAEHDAGKGCSQCDDADRKDRNTP